MPNPLLLLGSFGLTFLLLESRLMGPVRDILAKSSWVAELMECWFCSGFWCSLVVMYLGDFGWPGSLESFIAVVKTSWPDLIIKGFAGASFVYGLDLLLRFLEAHDAECS